MGIIALSWLLAALGCGTPRGTASVPLTERGPVVQVVATGERITFEALLDRLMISRVIYVGERHDEPEDHLVQRAIAEGLSARGSRVGMAFEMFRQSEQPLLDRYGASSLEEAAFLAAVDWEHGWGYDFAFYRPLLLRARTDRAPLIALNAEQSVTRTVAREGLDALTPEVRASLPELDLAVPSHRERVQDMLRQHPGIDDATLERYYVAQVIWDEVMAARIAQYLESEAASAEDAPRLVVIAGSMHVQRDAIPARVQRRVEIDDAVVESVDDLAESGHAVDYLVLVRGAGSAR